MPEKKQPSNSRWSQKSENEDMGMNIHGDTSKKMNSPNVEDGEKKNIESVKENETSISSSLVRLRKNIVFHELKGAQIDPLVVNPDFYNAFDCSSIPEIMNQEKFILGITSPESSDGKTLAASNLAVSAAMSLGKETVLVDFNIGRARLHKVFGIPLGPGLLDALKDTVVHVSRTNVRHLSILTAGNPLTRSMEAAGLATIDFPNAKESTIGLEQLNDFRNLMYSLEREFDLVIVDLPSIRDSGLPSLFAKQLDGILVVVNAGRTKKRELNQVLYHLTASNVIGFIFNRLSKDWIV
jgi:Mrp family chromosome partitioning ATPase